MFRLADAAAQYPIPEVGEQYRVLVLVLAFCGLRWGEATGLKVERVDWLKRRLSVKVIFRRIPSQVTAHLRDCFDRAAEDAGLHGLTPHELGHACASLAVSAGANVKAVQRMLGHKKASMTLDVYTDLFEDDLDGVAERLDAATVADGYPVGTRDGRAEVINLRPSR